MTDMRRANPGWPGMVALWLVLGCEPDRIEAAGDWAAEHFGPVAPDPVQMVTEMRAAIEATR